MSDEIDPRFAAAIDSFFAAVKRVPDPVTRALLVTSMRHCLEAQSERMQEVASRAVADAITVAIAKVNG